MAAQEVAITVLNHVSGTRGARQISLTLPASTKIGQLKTEIGGRLTPPKTGPELCLLRRGKDLTEDLKTLKEVGMKSHQPDGSVAPVRVTVALQQADALGGTTEPQYTPAQLNERVDELKAFMEGLACSDDVVRLALKKCKLDLAEAIEMLTSEQLGDLEEEVRAEQEANDDMQLMTNARVDGAGQGGEDEPEVREQRLSEMISNRSECFDCSSGC